MVKLNQNQREHKYRGYTERINEDRIWTALDLNQRTIVCFFERDESGSENWLRLLNSCKTHVVHPMEQVIDGRRAIYVCVNSKYRGAIRLAASYACIAGSSGVAYPSEKLMEEVQQALRYASTFRYYDVVIRAIPGQSLGVYIVYKNEHPIYVGRTTQLLSQRMVGHSRSQRKPDDSAGFSDYTRYHRICSHDWPVQFLPYEQCTSLAVLGQLTPDLVGDWSSQQQLTERYSQDREWGLAQAEAALIACLRPHFNQEKNTYRHPLQQTDYCQQYCRICLRPSQILTRKRPKHRS